MRRRKLAKSLVSSARLAATLTATIAVDAARFVVDVVEEGVQAFDEFGEHVEKKLEEIDEVSEEDGGLRPPG